MGNRTIKPGRTVNREATEAFVADMRNFPKTDEGWHRFPNKGWLGQQGEKYGKSGAWGSMTLKGLEAKGRIQVVREGRAVRGVVLLGEGAAPTLQAAVPTVAEPQPTPESQPEQPTTGSLRERLVALLQREADEHGKVRLTADDMRRRLDSSIHDVNKMLYDLKKAGQLTFRESRSGKSMNLLGFRLQGELMPRRAPASGALVEWAICPECWWDRRYHRRGADRSVLICPEPPKQGSPRATARESGELKPVGTRVMPTRANKAGPAGRGSVQRTEPPGPVITWYECHEMVLPPGKTGKEPCGQRFSDPVGLRMHKDAKHGGEPLPQNVRLPLDPCPTCSVASALHRDVAQGGDHDFGQPRPPLHAPEAQAAASAQAVTEAASREDWADQVRWEERQRALDWGRYPLLTEVAKVYAARVQARRVLEAVGDQIPPSLAHGPIGKAGTGTRIAEEITRLLAALGYEGAADES